MRKMMFAILSVAALGWMTQLATVPPACAKSAIADLPSGPGDRGDHAKFVAIESRHRQLAHTIDGPETSFPRLHISYLQHFEVTGREVVFSGPGEDLGARDGFILMSRIGGLQGDGRVVVNAILFAFDNADILPGSADAPATARIGVARGGPCGRHRRVRLKSAALRRACAGCRRLADRASRHRRATPAPGRRRPDVADHAASRTAAAPAGSTAP